MNNEIIGSRIREVLETITEQVDTLREYKGKIPQIEFDIVLQNVRDLYQELHDLQRMNDPHGQAARPEPSQPPPARKETKEKKAEKPAAPDLFAEEHPTFNIKLQEARDKSLGSKPSHSDHLKALISINDKFIFINELFDGNLREYNETIETLNGFKDLRQALEFFDLVRTKNLWDPASMAFTKLQEVLEKKFG